MAVYHGAEEVGEGLGVVARPAGRTPSTESAKAEEIAGSQANALLVAGYGIVMVSHAACAASVKPRSIIGPGGALTRRLTRLRSVE